MNDSSNGDMVAFLEKAEKWTGAELDLEALQLGDRLLVRTRNTNYMLVLVGDHLADLNTNRADRQTGKVQIQGCTFGSSMVIKPNHLFCGGALELKYLEGGQTVVTTPIESIHLLRTDGAKGGADEAD